VVRSVLVTALNLDIGRWVWWPGKLMHVRDEPESQRPAPDKDLAPATP